MINKNVNDELDLIKEIEDLLEADNEFEKKVQELKLNTKK